MHLGRGTHLPHTYTRIYATHPHITHSAFSYIGVKQHRKDNTKWSILIRKTHTHRANTDTVNLFVLSLVAAFGLKQLRVQKLLLLIIIFISIIIINIAYNRRNTTFCTHIEFHQCKNADRLDYYYIANRKK